MPPSLLDEISAALGVLPAHERESVEADARAATAAFRWVPNPGPQTEGFFCAADETFYGGQAGGGKTDLGIGLAIAAHRRSLILRRINKDALKIVPRIEEILGTRAGYNGQLQRWKLDGKQIDIAGCEQESDKQRFKGDPHDLLCVGAGTPVLVTGGQYVPIERLRAGDLVATLEGPRKIVRVFPPRRKNAVRVTARDAQGRIVGQQTQSSNHPLLTNKGWISGETILAAGQDAFCEPIEYGSVGTPLEASRRKFRLAWRLPEAILARLLRIALRGLPLLGRLRGVGIFAGVEQGLWGTDSVTCGDGRQVQPLLPLLFARSVPPQPARLLVGEKFAGSSAGCDKRDVLRTSLPADYLSRCSFGIRRCGGRIRVWMGLDQYTAGGQLWLHQSFDVGQPSPTDSGAGVRGKTRTHSLRTLSYFHPYTKETRRTPARRAWASYEVVPVGLKELYDIQVEEVNHYITKGGFVNQNCFDEGTDFLESQYRFIVGWNRSTDPGQRCRVLVTSNPPTTSEGLWVIRYWAPWLDPAHPKPAQPGELRWFTTIEGQDTEVDGPGPHMIAGEKLPVTARSRTYLPASLADNPDLAATGYASVLAGLPEELRRAYRDGDFSVGLRDNNFQVIPTAWIVAAQGRWRPDGHKPFAMTAMGFDPAGGGKDSAELAWRHGGWYAPLISANGEETADGSASAATIIRYRRNNAPVIVDVGGGYGGAVTLRLKDNGIAHSGHNGAGATNARTRDGQLKFVNKRAEAWWRFREELDPDQEGGSAIALPPDPELRADLAAPSYEVGPRGLLIESKDDIRKRLGRSPGKGDAVVMCLSQGNAAVKKQLQSHALMPSTATRGFEHMKRKR